MNNKVFCKISRNVFSVKSGDAFISEGSILNMTDGRIIRIIYELMVGSDYRGLYKNSLNGLIRDCDCPVNNRNKEEYKNLINKLNDIGSIEIKEFSNNRVVIDTDELYNNAVRYGYVILEQKEIDKINSISSNNKMRNNLLKCYLFIKLMCNKREDNSENGLCYNLETQSITMDYDYISIFSGVSNVYNCITKLKENNLINYENFLEAPNNNKMAKRDSKNTYVVRALEKDWNIELMNLELKYAINQYKDRRRKDGYIIYNKYLNNDKSENGRKGINKRNGRKKINCKEK